jgi:anti-sigma B factor antagonist
MEGIEISYNKVGAMRDIVLLGIRGYVDTQTSPELQQRIFDLMKQGMSQFVIDLSAVQYVSSAGWGVFVSEIRGLREKGGDLIIIHMLPEVTEVFEMLEFNKILTCSDSLEEAIHDFDLSKGLDLTSTLSHQSDSDTVPSTDVVNRVLEERNRKRESRPVSKEPHRSHRLSPLAAGMSDAELPLSEKIKKLVVENPNNGAWAIKRSLNSPRFGYVKISLFALISLMKRLGLGSKAKRYRYYRSR